MRLILTFPYSFNFVRLLFYFYFRRKFRFFLLISAAFRATPKTERKKQTFMILTFCAQICLRLARAVLRLSDFCVPLQEPFLRVSETFIYPCATTGA